MNDFEKINTDLATLFRGRPGPARCRKQRGNERLPGGSIP